MACDLNPFSRDLVRPTGDVQLVSIGDPDRFSVSLQVVSHAESGTRTLRLRDPDMAGFPTPSDARPPDLPSIEGVRVRVEGKFFRLGESKFTAKGVTYGPFIVGPDGEPIPSPDQALRDLQLIRELGANVIRVYHVPPRWFLNLALEQGIRVFVDVPWNKHLCFLDDAAAKEAALRAIRDAAERCSGHPAVFALSVVNEIPADVVRWSGARAVSDFVDALIAQAKAVDPGLLCTFGNFPTTEFLRPRLGDFECWNVYLHQQRPFENYIARLQMLADARPLVLGDPLADRGQRDVEIRHVLPSHATARPLRRWQSLAARLIER